MTTEKLQASLNTIRQFIQTGVQPLENDFLRRPFRELLPRLKAKREQVKALGLWAPHLPPALGGLGLSLSEFARISEELGRTPLGHYLFNCQAPDIGNMEILIEHGTPEQKKTWLEPLTRGEIPARAVRLNISLDDSLLLKIDRAARARSMTRSGFIAQATRKALEEIE